MSVDPVTASSINGGNFNRYWYGNNNPYRFTDPDGRLGIDGLGGPCDLRPCSTGPHRLRSAGPFGEIPREGGGDVKRGGGDTKPKSSSENDGCGGADDYCGESWRDGTNLKKAFMAAAGGAAAVESKALYELSKRSAFATAAGVRYAWKNLSFDGPQPGLMHLNGRIVGVRWKRSEWGIRLDFHPIKGSENVPILHINKGPLGRGEADYIILYDPRWFKEIPPPPAL